LNCPVEISLGLNVRRPDLLETRSTGDVLLGIKSGEWRKQVDVMRALPAESLEQREAKRRLPFVTWAGVFSRRGSDALVKHSGQCGVDLDDLGDSGAIAVIQTAVADKHCLAAFRSARGEGVRLLFRIPPCSAHDHSVIFEQVAEHVRRVYSCEPDTSGRDVGRASFVSFDSGLWFHAEAQVLPVVLPEYTQRVGGGKSLCVTRSIYTGQLAETWATWYGRNSVIIGKRPDGTTGTHKGLLDLGKSVALHAERIKEPLTNQQIDAAFDAWFSEHVRQGVPLRGTAEEYRRELVISVRGAQRKPWFKAAAEKWIRWTRHADFPHAALPREKIIFAIRKHCDEAQQTEFFLGARDAALVAGVCFKTGAKLLCKLVANGVLEKVGERQHPRHAQTYRLKT
jgi:hypothetical protein